MAVCVGLAVNAAQAARWVGSGDRGKWSDAQNWSGGVLPANDGTEEIVFGGTRNTAVHLDAAWDVKSVMFDSSAGAFTFEGQVLTVQGAGDVESKTINNRSMNKQTFVSTIKLGQNQGWYNAKASGRLIFNGGIETNGCEFRVNSEGVVHINGPITGDGVIKRNGAGTLVLASVGSDFSGYAPGAYNGTLVFTQDVPLDAKGPFGRGNAWNPVFLGASGNSNASLLAGGAVTMERTVLINPTGRGSATVGGKTQGESTFSGDIILGQDGQPAAAVSLTAAKNGIVTFAGNLRRADKNPSGQGDHVTKKGVGVVVLAGDKNNYAGATTIAHGTLQIDGTLTKGGGEVTVNKGARLTGRGMINRKLVVQGELVVTPSGGSITVGGDLDIAQGGLVLSEFVESSDHLVVVRYAGALTGKAFARVSGLPQGAVLDYGTGKDSEITLEFTFSEPSSVVARLRENQERQERILVPK